MGFLDKFLNKFTNRAGDKLADKMVNKLFGKDTEKTNTTVKEVQTAQNETPNITVEQPKNNVAADLAQSAMMTAMAKEQTKQMKLAQENMAQANAMTANMGGMAGFASMAQANEIMNYMIFDDNMEIVGVKENAPDWLKQAYKSGKLNN